MAWTEKHKLAQKKYIEKHRLRVLLRKAKLRTNWECDLDEEFLYTLKESQQDKCALTKLPLNNDSSIDRIDSSKGYTKDNVQLLLTIVNRMKRDLPQEQFIYFCKEIARNN